MIKVENISKSYGKVNALKNVSFEIERGRIVGFLGPNGAGKSTTLKILTGYIPPDNGNVEIAGINVLENSVEARKRIGYLPETTPLYKNMKVIEYLRFAAEAREVEKGKIDERIRFVIKRLGLEKVAYKAIKSLSKGYKQRVGLGQAIIHDPEILILDEPTSGLDPNQVMEIRKLIKEIGKDHTVIFSTHILQEIEAVCDDIIIISNGEIVSSGTKEQLSTGKGYDIELVIKKVDNEIHATFEDIESISKIAFRDINEDEINIDITADADIRERLFHHAKENNITLLEMKKKNINLEDIFKKLTVN